MKRFAIFFLIFSSLLFFNSCETDFDINANYQDVTVVFGLLDQDSTTYVKINKAFLGEGNALIMAQIEDSSNYLNELNVTIEEWSGSDHLNTFELDTITITNKEEGVFYNPYQILYKTDAPLNEDNTYKLRIINGEKEITSETKLINDFYMTKPRAGGTYIVLTETTQKAVEWVSAINGKRYEVVIRFNYKEKFIDQADTVYKHIDWVLGTVKSNTSIGGEEMEMIYFGESFYFLCAQNIPYNDQSIEDKVHYRLPLNLDFIISVAGEDMNTYMEVNEPSSSIVQDKPEFTNIENGIGLFSSRYQKTRSKLLKSESVAILRDLNIKF